MGVPVAAGPFVGQSLEALGTTQQQVNAKAHVACLDFVWDEKCRYIVGDYMEAHVLETKSQPYAQIVERTVHDGVAEAARKIFQMHGINRKGERGHRPTGIELGSHQYACIEIGV